MAAIPKFRNLLTAKGIDSRLPASYNDKAGFYLAWYVTPHVSRKIYLWAKSNGFLPLEESDYHCTIAYSKTIPYNETFKAMGMFKSPLNGQITGIKKLGQKAIVFIVDCHFAETRHNEAMAAGCTHDYPSFICHVTFTYNGSAYQQHKLDALKLPTFDIEFNRENFSPLRSALSAALVNKSNYVGSESQTIAIVDRAANLDIAWNKLAFYLTDRPDGMTQVDVVKRRDAQDAGGYILASSSWDSYAMALEHAYRSAREHTAFKSTIYSMVENPVNQIVADAGMDVNGTYFFRTPKDVTAAFRMHHAVMRALEGVSMLRYTPDKWHISIAKVYVRAFGAEVPANQEFQAIGLHNPKLKLYGDRNSYTLGIEVKSPELSKQHHEIMAKGRLVEMQRGVKTLTNRDTTLHLSLGKVTTYLSDKTLDMLSSKLGMFLTIESIDHLLFGAQQHEEATFPHYVAHVKPVVPIISPSVLEPIERMKVKVRQLEAKANSYMQGTLNRARADKELAAGKKILYTMARAIPGYKVSLK